jgi:hypothetical protein
LVPDTQVRGRILDTQGKPVAGATVIVRGLTGFRNDSAERFLTYWLTRDPSDQHIPSDWSAWFRRGSTGKLPSGDHFLAATTDADGRFTIQHVGAERVATLHVRGIGVADAEVVVVTRAGFEPSRYNRATALKLRRGQPDFGYNPALHGPEPAVVIEAEKLVRGVVRETATGKPRAGVVVTLHHRDERRISRIPELTATTDRAGRYEIHGANKATSYRLSVPRDPADGILGRTITVTDTTGYEPVAADIAVAKGVVLTGRILDGATGRTVPGFACVGTPFDNPFVKSRPEFDSPDCYHPFADTGPDGIYRTVVPPGPVILMGGATSTDTDWWKVRVRYEPIKPDPDYPRYFRPGDSTGFISGPNSLTAFQGNYCKVLQIDPARKEVVADIVLKRTGGFTVKVRDADGKPLPGAVAVGVADGGWGPLPCDGDTCTIYGLAAANPRLVIVYHPARGFAGSITLTGTEKEPAEVTLRPTAVVSGKLVTPDGRPVVGARVHLEYSDRAAEELDREIRSLRMAEGKSAETGSSGEFTIDAVIPGATFMVSARKGSLTLTPQAPKKPLGVTVGYGEAKNLGDLVVKNPD